MISFETERSREFTIDQYVCLSVNPKESAIRPLALDALKALSKYLDRERVVAIGEIGYNLINDSEDELFQLQLDIALEKKMLTMIHLPHVNKKDGIERTKSVLIKKNLLELSNKILIDHNTEETIQKTLELGCWAGLTVYPITKLSPTRAIDIIEKNGVDKIMINSSADWGISDPLSVPLVAREMKKRGFSKNDIEKVTFYNAYEFFKQSSKFLWRP
jgi:predicted metal-dependent TIM-barrel fold hydrolase